VSRKFEFGEALGEDGLKKLDHLVAESVESTQHELFQIDPRMSYVPEEWIRADPEFWKPKAQAMAKPAADDKKSKPEAPSYKPTAVQRQAAPWDTGAAWRLWESTAGATLQRPGCTCIRSWRVF
jgi:hypothetical protein